MDELMIAGAVGKAIDALLIDQDPLGGSELPAHQAVQGGDGQ
jgi:hypothetical protein